MSLQLRNDGNKYNNSLDNFLQSNCEKLSDDKTGVYYINGTHFTLTSNNKMHIYHINQDNNNKKCNILKILNQETMKWNEYKLKNSAIINVEGPYIWHPSLAVIIPHNNNNIKNKYSYLFIKYSAPFCYRAYPHESKEYDAISTCSHPR